MEEVIKQMTTNSVKRLPNWVKKNIGFNVQEAAENDFGKLRGKIADVYSIPRTFVLLFNVICLMGIFLSGWIDNSGWSFSSSCNLVLSFVGILL